MGQSKKIKYFILFNFYLIIKYYYIYNIIKEVLIMNNENFDQEVDYETYVEDNNKHYPKGNNSFKSITISKVIVFAIIFGLIAGVVFAGFNIITNKLRGTNSSSSMITSTNVVESDGQANSDVSTVARECIPSIVSITNMTIQEVQGFYSFFYGNGGNNEYEQKSAGSGIIVGKNDTELLIVTNNHVVEGATTLTVSFYKDEENPVTALLKGTASDKDLAVISVKLSDIKDETMKNIKIATLGDSSKLQIGEQAIAIGNALGYGTSVTSGIISAIDRKVGENAASGSSTSFFDFFGGGDGGESNTTEEASINGTFIQTDAAINPGNSGGALLNSKGEVIGINSAKIVSTSAEGIGYAIPISDANPIINDLMNDKTREVVSENERGYLGISCKSIDSETSKSYDMPKGVYIIKTNKNEAADKAGLQKGDIITKIENDSVTSVEAIQKKLSYYKVGEEVKVTYSRLDSKGNYKSSTATVKLTKSSKEDK